MNFLFSAIIAAAVSVGSFFGLQHEQQNKPLSPQIQQAIQQYVEQSQQAPSFGTTLPIAGTTYNLSGAGVSQTATSITLASFTIPQTGYKILDADLSTTFYITLEPGNSTRQEIVSCTTDTQNANGSATFSGCTRGLSPISPYTASTTLRFSHGGGTQVIFSNPPQLFNEYLAKQNNESITGLDTFDIPPILNDANATSSSQAASRAFVTSTAFGSTPVLVTAGGTGNTSFPSGSFIMGNGTGALAASSSPTANYYFASSTTATSTFKGGFVVEKSVTVSGNQSITGDLTVGGTITGTISVAPFGLLGNAADGNITYNGTTNLTRDVYAGDVTVNGTVFTNGWRIFATGTVAVANGGKISAEGKVGIVGVSGTTVAGGAGGGAATSTGLLGTSTPGSAGGNSNGNATSNTNSFFNALGGTGGDGGTSPAAGGRAKGAFATSTMARFLNITDLMSLMVFSTSTSAYVAARGGGGGGGGGGGNGDSGGGGGGGGGGGIVAIFAKNVTVATGGTITAVGGQGGGGGTSNGMGGGGGGGGAVIIGYTTTYTNSGTVAAAGGAVGASPGGGAAPDAGSAGTVITLKMQ